MDTRLKKARLKRGETTYEVAAKVGVSQAQYHRVENGASGASRELATRLARHFGDSVTELEILYPERYLSPEEFPKSGTRKPVQPAQLQEA